MQVLHRGLPRKVARWENPCVLPSMASGPIGAGIPGDWPGAVLQSIALPWTAGTSHSSLVVPMLSAPGFACAYYSVAVVVVCRRRWRAVPRRSCGPLCRLPQLRLSVTNVIRRALVFAGDATRPPRRDSPGFPGPSRAGCRRPRRWRQGTSKKPVTALRTMEVAAAFFDAFLVLWLAP